MKDFKLSTVARQCGIEVCDESLHDALYDIRLTMEVYKKVVSRQLSAKAAPSGQFLEYRRQQETEVSQQTTKNEVFNYSTSI